jgi:hypothetical protein
MEPKDVTPDEGTSGTDPLPLGRLSDEPDKVTLHLAKPTPKGLASLFERLTGKKLSPERRSADQAGALKAEDRCCAQPAHRGGGMIIRRVALPSTRGWEPS